MKILTFDNFSTTWKVKKKSDEWREIQKYPHQKKKKKKESLETEEILIEGCPNGN